MATLEQVQDQLTTVRTQVGEQGASLARIADSQVEIQKDIQVLKDQVGTGTPGITPEEADGVLASLQDIGGRVEVSNAALKAAADALEAIGNAQ
jgi:capsule polysaccharide export protein KpsE/RkpR